LAYDILGLVVENFSHQSFEEYVKSNVLLRAGMLISDFNYYRIPDSLKVFPHSRRAITKKIHQRKNYPYTREHSPSSTLNSSAVELSKWMISFLKQLDKDETMLPMTKPSTPIYPSIGLAFQLYTVQGKKSIGHFGGDKGFRSYLLMIPEEKLGFVVLANCDFNEDFRQEIISQLVTLFNPAKK
jgi:CubicO group peptidase (beta-lactamase class C family)